MFNLGIQELAVIFIIALLFIGPKQLPELAKTLGKVFRDFKRATNEIADSLQREARQITDYKEELKDDIKKDMKFELLPETASVAMVKETPKPQEAPLEEIKSETISADTAANDNKA